MAGEVTQAPKRADRGNGGRFSQPDVLRRAMRDSCRRQLSGDPVWLGSVSEGLWFPRGRRD